MPRHERLVADIRWRLDYVGRELPGLLRRLADAQRGYPASSRPAGGSGSGGGGSLVERHADGADPAEATRTTIERLLLALDDDTADLVGQIISWSPARHAPTDEGCMAMARIGRGWEPVWRNVDIDGVRWALGRWAYDFYGAAGRLPSIEECEAHAAGRRVRRSA